MAFRKTLEKVICRVISDLFRNLADLQIRIPKAAFCIFQAKFPDQIREGVSGIFFDQRAEMRLRIVKEGGKVRQREGPVIVLYVLKDQREIAPSVIIIIADGLRIFPEKFDENQLDQTDDNHIAVGISGSALNDCASKEAFESSAVFQIEHQEIGLFLVLQDGLEEIRQEIAVLDLP